MSFKSFLDQVGLIPLRRLSSEDSIYLCRERATQRLIVAKQWPDALRLSAEREAKALIDLGELGLSPRIGACLESAEGPVLLREYLAGKTLEELAAEPPSPKSRKALTQVASVIEKVHAKGWTHRDLTPRNILLTPDDRVVILDWDLAEQLDLQNLSSFQPRGTVGFSVTEPSRDLIAQDLEALLKISEFLQQPFDGPETSKQDHSRKKWIKGLFSVRR